jgi:monoamine oxidase
MKFSLQLALRLLAVVLLTFRLNDKAVDAAVSKDARIIIVGAGVSGLSAAAQLKSKGMRNIILIEATVRIGGRIDTITYS